MSEPSKYHIYSPDFQAMGDCRVCGQMPEDHLEVAQRHEVMDGFVRISGEANGVRKMIIVAAHTTVFVRPYADATKHGVQFVNSDGEVLGYEYQLDFPGGIEDPKPNYAGAERNLEELGNQLALMKLSLVTGDSISLYDACHQMLESIRMSIAGHKELAIREEMLNPAIMMINTAAADEIMSHWKD